MTRPPLTRVHRHAGRRTGGGAGACPGSAGHLGGGAVPGPAERPDRRTCIRPAGYDRRGRSPFLRRSVARVAGGPSADRGAIAALPGSAVPAGRAGPASARPGCRGRSRRPRGDRRGGGRGSRRLPHCWTALGHGLGWGGSGPPAGDRPRGWSRSADHAAAAVPPAHRADRSAGRATACRTDGAVTVSAAICPAAQCVRRQPPAPRLIGCRPPHREPHEWRPPSRSPASRYPRRLAAPPATAGGRAGAAGCPPGHGSGSLRASARSNVPRPEPAVRAGDVPGSRRPDGCCRPGLVLRSLAPPLAQITAASRVPAARSGAAPVWRDLRGSGGIHGRRRLGLVAPVGRAIGLCALVSGRPGGWRSAGAARRRARGDRVPAAGGGSPITGRTGGVCGCPEPGWPVRGPGRPPEPAGKRRMCRCRDHEWDGPGSPEPRRPDRPHQLRRRRPSRGRRAERDRPRRPALPGGPARTFARRPGRSPDEVTPATVEELFAALTRTPTWRSDALARAAISGRPSCDGADEVRQGCSWTSPAVATPASPGPRTLPTTVCHRRLTSARGPLTRANARPAAAARSSWPGLPAQPTAAHRTTMR